MFFQLIYVSRAVEEIDTASLDEILGSARRNNAKLDITGMLLFHEGSFIQVLEEEKVAVEKLFKHICEDPRHQETNVVLRTEVAERAFNRWSMGYKRTSKIEDVPKGFHPFLQRGYKRQTQADVEAARKTLLAFKEGRWRL